MVASLSVQSRTHKQKLFSRNKTMLRSILLGLLLFSQCVAASDSRPELSEEAKEFLEEFKAALNDRKVVPVEIDPFEINNIIDAWQLNLANEKDVPRFIDSCITGRYEDAGKVIGKSLVKEGRISESQYSQLRKKCVGHGGIIPKTWAIWTKILHEISGTGRDLREVLK